MVESEFSIFLDNDDKVMPDMLEPRRLVLATLDTDGLRVNGPAVSKMVLLPKACCANLNEMPTR